MSVTLKKANVYGAQRDNRREGGREGELKWTCYFQNITVKNMAKIPDKIDSILRQKIDK